ncbi:MAG: hypothetical protein AB7S86_11220 [Hydrogenophaga sp.]|uniref:hypothetical protein n=1 Tax=Hydrogenophaga sp. TaxID=1904254 RepID=UPI003D0A3970
MTKFMPRPTRLPAALLAAGLLLTPAAGMSESALGGQARPASAALDFRIIIPPVMQVLENSHPVQLAAEASGDWSAEQRLVVVSNMKRGFCVTLRMNAPEVEAWRLQPVQSRGMALTPVADGYRMCSMRPGRYTLLLQHEFNAATGNSQGAMAWPVQTDITAL